jgi:hypothetical protein
MTSHHQHGQITVLWCWQWLGQHISNHFFGWAILEVYLSILHLLAIGVVLDVDVI